PCARSGPCWVARRRMAAPMCRLCRRPRRRPLSVPDLGSPAGLTLDRGRWYIVRMTTELLRRRPPDDVDDAFDIDSFKTRSAPVSLEGIDLDSFRDQPLDPDS